LLIADNACPARTGLRKEPQQSYPRNSADDHVAQTSAAMTVARWEYNPVVKSSA